MERPLQEWGTAVMFPWIHALLGVLILIAAPAPHAADVTSQDVRVVATPVLVDGKWGLSLEMTNRGSQEILVPEDSLPWLCSNAALILAVEYRVGTLSDPLSGTSRFGSCGSAGRSHLIAPGSTSSGVVQLSDYVSGFEEALESGDVALFWFWRLRFHGQKRDEDHGGYTIVRGESSAHGRISSQDEVGVPAIAIDAVRLDEVPRPPSTA